MVRDERPAFLCETRGEARGTDVEIGTFHAAHTWRGADCTVIAVREVSATHVTRPFSKCIQVGIVGSTPMAD